MVATFGDIPRTFVDIHNSFVPCNEFLFAVIYEKITRKGLSGKKNQKNLDNFRVEYIKLIVGR